MVGGSIVVIAIESMQLSAFRCRLTGARRHGTRNIIC